MIYRSLHVYIDIGAHINNTYYKICNSDFIIFLTIFLRNYYKYYDFRFFFLMMLGVRYEVFIWIILKYEGFI